MFFTQSLIKRYTPPTCTLKIFSNRFSWAKLTGIFTPENLSFELNVDDPRLAEHQQLTLKGNYQQLAVLSQTVRVYIHQLLQPSCQPSPNLLRHQLTWDLSPTGNFELTPTQLFDLANALEQYQREIDSKIGLSITKKANKGLLAAIATLSVGFALGTFALIKLNSKPSPQALESTPEAIISTATESSENGIVIINSPSLDFEKPELVIPEYSQDYAKLSPPDSVNFPTPEPISTPPPVPNPPNPPNLPNLPNPPLSKFPTFNSPPQPPPTRDFSANLPSPQEEIQAYFQKRWQPPSNLSEKLEYRLIIAKSGNLKAIIPVGRAAQIYLDKVKPSELDPMIISPLKAKNEVKIRLILTPNGLVQTFKEDS